MHRRQESKLKEEMNSQNTTNQPNSANKKERDQLRVS
jgi:hypothetical protein